MMRPAARLLPLLALFVPSLVGAQGPTSPLDRRIDSVFAAFSRTNTPGCAVGVDRGPTALIRRAYGMANLESGTPFTTGTISESGSTAKQFVAASLVMLALDGTLSLDDDVIRWIPEVQGIGKRITIRHLLSHTSGLPDRYTLHDVEGRPAGEVDHPNAEVLAVVAKLRDLNFDPGEDYLYSNTAYVVAVAVLERASGKSLQAFSQERIFGPLGMSSTLWREDHRAVVAGRAPAYSGNTQVGFRNDHPFTRVFGSGGLLLTIDDFLKWSGAMQRREGRWGAIADSLSAVITLNDGTAITYGLGVSTDTWRGVKRVSHTGSTGGYRAALYRFPDQAVSIALLCNIGAANPGGLATSVASIVLGEALQPVVADATPAIAMTPEALAALAGRYHSPRTEEAMILEVRNGQLVDSSAGTVYLPRGNGRFRARGGVAEIEFSSGAKPPMSGAGATSAPPPGAPGSLSVPARMRYQAPSARAVEYVRVDAPDLSPAAFASFAGAYRSPELGAPLDLVVKDGRLVIDRAWRGVETLRPLFRDAFTLPGGELIRFTRDARGRITGFVVWAGRVRHLRFDRVTPAR